MRVGRKVIPMKKSLLAATAVALVISAGSALAADLPSRKEAPIYVPPPPPVYTWTGAYGGVNIGGAWLSTYNYNNLIWGWNGAGWNQGFAWNDTNGPGGGVAGGGQAGYNYQISPLFVVGVETDIQGASVGSGGSAWNGATRSVDWFGTVRGRLGVSLFSPQLLFYGTGGFAYGGINLNPGWLGQLGATGTGWTGGGGVEWAFMPNWSAKVEYLYVNIGASNWGGYNQLEQRVHMNVVRAGVNYHFNWFAPAPVVAKY